MEIPAEQADHEVVVVLVQPVASQANVVSQVGLSISPVQ